METIVSITFIILLFNCLIIENCDCHDYYGSVEEEDNCIPIKECPEVVSLLLTKPLTEEIRRKLFNLKCGQNENVIQVWCRKNEQNENNSVKCLPIKECPAVIELLKTKPITDKIKEDIKRLKCGADGKLPKVWCPIKNKLSGIDLLPSISRKECGITSENTIMPIVAGGEDANLGEFPWMAMLEYRLKNNKLAAQCGGSLINQQYVLSAAHCLLISDRQGKLESILFGELDTSYESPDEERYLVHSFLVHPLYEESAKAGLYHHDIGLVRLQENVDYTDYIIPICLPPQDYKEKMDKELYWMKVAGWGLTETGTTSPELQKLKVPYYDSLECTKLLMYNVTDTQLCAGGEQGRDSCRGDSGGPLMYYRDGFTTQVGIVSLSIGKTCGAGRPNIYTKVEKYVTWIYDSLRP